MNTGLINIVFKVLLLIVILYLLKEVYNLQTNIGSIFSIFDFK